MIAVTSGPIRPGRSAWAARGRAALVCLAFALSLAGCATTTRPQASGTLSGKFTLIATGETRIIFVPDKRDPLTFVTSDGRKIQPKRVYTDGGTIPPVFWLVPGLSPWEYAPAYVIHDWLFRQHHCRYDGYREVSFDDSARILDDVMNTLQERGLVPPHPEARVLVGRGARSPIARFVWKFGRCTRQDFGTARTASSGIATLRLDFSSRRAPF